MEEQIIMLPVVLAVEARAGDAAGIPRVLERPAAEALGDALAADLVRLLPRVTEFGMATVGALYDQTEVLRPGYPLFACLEELYRESLQGSFTARRLILGAAGGALPKPALKPSESIHAGPLLLVPVALFGGPQQTRALAAELEEVLVGSGQASVETCVRIREKFGIEPVRAQYLSINDLAAMLSLQLGNIGLPELWTLLEGALYAPGENRWVTTTWGGAFACHEGGVDALFQTFDAWARHGAGANVAAEEASLTAGYADYLRAERQFVVTLAAHKIKVAVFPILGALPAGLEEWLATPSDPARRCFVETALDGPAEGPLRITEQLTGQLGSVAFTVEWGRPARRRENHYPVSPRGVVECLAHLQTLPGDDRIFAYPGRICCDADGRRLSSDPDALGEW